MSESSRIAALSRRAQAHTPKRRKRRGSLLALLLAASFLAVSVAPASAWAYLSHTTGPVSSSLRVTGTTYELVYDANGGDPASVPSAQAATSFEASHRFSVSDVKPQRAGMRFVGWSIAPDGGLTHRSGDAVELTSATPSATLYAVWSDHAVLAPGMVTNARIKDSKPTSMNPAYNAGDQSVLSVTFGTPDQHAASVAGITGVPVGVESDFDLSRVESPAYTDVYPYSDAIMLYRVPNGNGFDVYILSEWKIYANERSDFLFNSLYRARSIAPISFDTSRTTTMRSMFSSCQSLTSLDLSEMDTSRSTSFASMFKNCAQLTNLDVTGFDTGAAMDMSEMFRLCGGLSNLDLARFNTANVTTMRDMFANCTRLKELDLRSFDTSRVTTMHEMFSSCTSLRSIDLSSFDTRSLTSTYRMFSNCQSLQALDVTGFETGSVTDMGDMFYNCLNLTSLDVSNFDTSNVTNMYEMFNNLRKVTELDLSSFDTGKATIMSNMFASCGKLAKINVSSFDTARVTSMSSMFAGCSSLERLDLSSFNTKGATSMGNMFKSCSLLKTIDAGPGWSTEHVTSSSDMFTGCLALSGGAGTTYNPEHADASYARIDGGKANPGYLTGANGAASLDPTKPDTDLPHVDDDPALSDTSPSTEADEAMGAETQEPAGEEPADGESSDGASKDDATKTRPNTADEESAQPSEPAQDAKPQEDAGTEPSPARSQTARTAWTASFKPQDFPTSPTAENPEASVTFDGGAQQFVFQPGTDEAPTDLFPGLKNAMPGDSLTQRIVVRNDDKSPTAVNLYLRSHGAQDGSRTLLSQLMLAVEREGMPELSEGPAHEPGALAEWVHVGTFEPGEEASLLLTLSLPTSLSDEHQGEHGTITWEFRADEASPSDAETAGPSALQPQRPNRSTLGGSPSNPTPSPTRGFGASTGDDAGPFAILAILSVVVASIGAACALVRSRR